MTYPMPPAPAPARTIGIDVGGTKTALCVAALPEGQIVHRTLIETPGGIESGAVFLERVAAEAARLNDRAAAEGAPCIAIGVSLCELVDLDGNVSSAHRVHWKGLPVGQRLASLLPAVVESDVRAAALAEARYGAGRDYAEFLYLNVGTGISACWVRAGVPHAGARGNALALASSPVSLSCEHCGKTTSYVPEDIAGGAGLAREYASRTGRAASAKDILAAAEEGDGPARQVIDKGSHALAVNLGVVIDMLDPEAVIVGGGLGTAGGLYWDRLVDATRAHIWSGSTRSLPIRPAALGAESALIGAAVRAWIAYGMSSPKLR